MTAMPAHNLAETSPKPSKPAAPPPRRSGRWIVLIVALAAANALGVAIYYGIASRVGAETALVQQTHETSVPFVSVIHPTANVTSTEISLPGDTQAFISTPIYARTSGYLKSWTADIGTHVKAGQLLAEIDTPELDQQLQQAQSELKNAQANLQISQATDARYQKLIATNAVSQQEADTTAADLSSKQALVDSSQANVRRLQQLQDFEKVYAPFDGVITARSTDIGALIQANETRELFHLASVNKLRIYVSVPEVYAPFMHNGDKTNLTLDSLPGENFVGTIVRNSDNIDPVTRTLNVEVDVDNPTGKLLPGAYVFVHFKFAAAGGSVSVPSNTLLFRSEGPRVGVMRDGHAKLVPVTIGHDYGVSLEVLSGLNAEDNVIVDPSDSLTDGAPVQLAPVTTKTP